MGRGPTWTQEDKDYLRNHYPGTSVKELAQTLNRTEPAVTNQLQNMGLRKTNRFWTKKELEYLETHYPTTHAVEIAETLNRGYNAVISKANKLGLKSVRYKRPWTDEDTKTLLLLHGAGFTRSEIGLRMDRAVATIQTKLRDEGLTKPAGHRYILMKAGLLEAGK